MLDDASVVESADGVGDAHDGVHLVGDEHDCQTQFVPDLGQEFQDGVGGGRVESGGGLVRQQHRRLQRQGAGDAHALALPAGELVGVQIRLVGQAHQVEQVGDPRRGGSLCRAQVLERKGDVLRCGPPREHTGRLEDRADAAAGIAESGGAEGGEVLAVDDDLARRRALQQVEAACERALARAGRADDGEDLAGGDGELDVVEHGGGVRRTDPEDLGESNDFDHRAVAITSCRWW